MRAITFDQVVQSFYDYNASRGREARYVGRTLEPNPLPADLEKFVEPLVINLDSVDCTTFVEYVSAAVLGRTTITYEGDSILRRFVQALRYRDGKRGNYASRNHYFTDWILNGEEQGLMTEVTPSLTGAVQQKKAINFMSANKRYYPQLRESTKLMMDVREIENYLSTRFTYYVPSAQIFKCYDQLQHGDIVAFVSGTMGLDIQHVGFVWKPEGSKMPRLLHASSTKGKVVVSDLSLQDYAVEANNCRGIRIVRLNAE